MIESALHNARRPGRWRLHGFATLGFFAEKDGFVPPQAARKLEADLRAACKEVEITIFEDAGHAFFNDARPETYHAGVRCRVLDAGTILTACSVAHIPTISGREYTIRPMVPERTRASCPPRSADVQTERRRSSSGGRRA